MGKGDVCHAVFNCATTDRGEISHVQWRPIAFACLVSKVIHRFCATQLPKLWGRRRIEYGAKMEVYLGWDDDYQLK